MKVVVDYNMTKKYLRNNVVTGLWERIHKQKKIVSKP